MRTENPTQPKECNHNTASTSICKIGKNPHGQTNKGVIWRCTYHGRLFVATIQGKALHKLTDEQASF